MLLRKSLQAICVVIVLGIGIKLFCPAIFDQVMCWPPAQPNTTVHLPCPESFEGTPYNSLSNATRTCFADGSWLDKTDYEACILPLDETQKANHHTIYLQAIFCIGYCISLLSLLLSLYVFVHFKSLHCLRNYIHANLMVTLGIRVAAWLTLYVTTHTPGASLLGLYNAISSIQSLASVSMLCWMFVEGANLLKIVYWTYGLHRIRIWHYAVFSWGLPTILILSWIIRNACNQPDNRWIEKDQGFYLISLPSLIILSCNALVLVSILYTLFCRLNAPKRSLNHFSGSDNICVSQLKTNPSSPPVEDNSPQHRHSTPEVVIRKNEIRSQKFYSIGTSAPIATINENDQSTLWIYYRTRFKLPTRFNRAESLKSLKSCLMLMPLLGIPQVIFIVPYHEAAEEIFQYINAVLTSTQGFWVALIYCFLNEEVRMVVKKGFMEKHLLNSLKVRNGQRHNRDRITKIRPNKERSRSTLFPPDISTTIIQ